MTGRPVTHEEARRLATALSSLDAAPRQTRTMAATAGLPIERTRELLERLERRGFVRREAGLWQRAR